MLYKPNFCCNCGEKIGRSDWNLLTSRRFCEACAGENKRHDRLPQLAVAGGVLGFIFGLGALFGSAREQQSPVQSLRATPVLAKPEPSATKTFEKVEALRAEPPAPVTTAQAPAPPLAEAELPAKAHYCGALTKKGTPCSRKVKVAGSRCFQHEGKPQMLPGA